MDAEPTRKPRNLYVAIYAGSVRHTRADSPEEAIDKLNLWPAVYPDHWVDWADPNEVPTPPRQEALREVVRRYRDDEDYILLEVTRSSSVSSLNTVTRFGREDL